MKNKKTIKNPAAIIILLSLLAFNLYAAKSYMDIQIQGTNAGQPTTVTVTDRDTNQPIENAVVEVYKDKIFWKNSIHKSKTDSQGQTTYTVNETGTYYITSEKEDYIPEEIKIEYAGTPAPEYSSLALLIAALLTAPAAAYLIARLR